MVQLFARCFFSSRRRQQQKKLSHASHIKPGLYRSVTPPRDSSVIVVVAVQLHRPAMDTGLGVVVRKKKQTYVQAATLASFRSSSSNSAMQPPPRHRSLLVDGLPRLLSRVSSLGQRGEKQEILTFSFGSLGLVRIYRFTTYLVSEGWLVHFDRGRQHVHPGRYRRIAGNEGRRKRSN